MVLLTIPRMTAAIARGYLARRRGSVAEGTGFHFPHVRSVRPSVLFDVDLFGHMNNAAFLVHAEMARWELSAATGLLEYALAHKAWFIVGSASVRFRRELKPFQRFEVHSQLIDFDDRWVTVVHEFRGAGDRASDLHAQGICRAVIKTSGGKTLVPGTVLQDIGVDVASRPPIPPEWAEVIGASARLDDTLRELASRP